MSMSACRVTQHGPWSFNTIASRDSLMDHSVQGWIWSNMFHYLAQLPSLSCQLPISPGRIGQTAEQPKSSQPNLANRADRSPCTSHGEPWANFPPFVSPLIIPIVVLLRPALFPLSLLVGVPRVVVVVILSAVHDYPGADRRLLFRLLLRGDSSYGWNLKIGNQNFIQSCFHNFTWFSVNFKILFP